MKDKTYKKDQIIKKRLMINRKGNLLNHSLKSKITAKFIFFINIDFINNHIVKYQSNTHIFTSFLS